MSVRAARGQRLLAIALCVVLNMTDGYDILIMAFSAPVISAHWHLEPSDLGLLFSAGVAGMGLGGITLAALADIVGRRRIILLCLCLTTAGMLLASTAESPLSLALFRFLTGLGVGGMMPAINTVVAEYSGDRHRAMAIVIQAAGYPLGGTVGGLLAMPLLENYGWRSLFIVGGILSALLIPAALRFVPESIEFLLHRRPPDALNRVNSILRRGGSAELTVLPAPATSQMRAGPATVLSMPLLRTTMLICAATFMVQFTFYFIINWAPSLISRVDSAAGVGISGAVLVNMGGIVGDVIFGFLCLRARARLLGAAAMLGCFALAALLQSASADMVLPTAFLLGCLLYASMASLYAVAPAVFPPLARSTGTGVALSVGRVGAAIGPWAGVTLFGGALSDIDNAVALLVTPLLLASLILICFLRERPVEALG